MDKIYVFVFGSKDSLKSRKSIFILFFGCLEFLPKNSFPRSKVHQPKGENFRLVKKAFAEEINMTQKTGQGR